MRTPSRSSGEIALGASEGFGIIGRKAPAQAALPASHRPIAVGNRRTNSPTPLGAALARAVRAIRAFAGNVRASWRQHRRERAMRVSLRALDARTLRDLGFDRSEVPSVVAELTGGAEITRLRCEPGQHGLDIW